MPLLQMHHQYTDGRPTSFIAQREINSHDEHREWLKELWERHPPKDGAYWMACNEKSRHFVYTVGEYDTKKCSRNK